MGDEIVGELMAIGSGDVVVNYNTPSVDRLDISAGCIRKITSMYHHVEEELGRKEACFLPLRISDEGLKRDIFIPKHYEASGGSVEWLGNAAAEFPTDNPENVVVDGWGHFHPRFHSLSPSNHADGDRPQNYRILYKRPQNKILGFKEVTMNNLDCVYDESKGYLMLSDLLTDTKMGIPLEPILNSLGMHSEQFDVSLEEQSELLEIVKDYFVNGPGIKELTDYQTIELQYIISIICTGIGEEQLLKLDGTSEGGYCRHIYAEALVREYINGVPGRIELLTGPTGRGLPTKVWHDVEGDVIVDDEEMRYDVMKNIVEPLRPPRRVRRKQQTGVDEEDEPEKEVVEKTPKPVSVKSTEHQTLIGALFSTFLEWWRDRPTKGNLK